MFGFKLLFVISVSLAILTLGFSQTVSGQTGPVHYVYVEPIPDFAASYASNVISDATTAWQNANPGLTFYFTNDPQKADLDVQWVKDFGSFNGRIGEEFDGHDIFVGLGDSNCGDTWQPYSSATVTHIAEHEIGHFLGFAHSSDPSDIMYPTTNVQYGTVTWQKNLDTGYVWFVPICTTRSVSSFAYSVSLSRQDDAFDAYFVPSVDEYNKFANNQQFQYYTGNGCSGTNWVSYSGTCEGVAQGSGLLIATHGHILINHLVTVTATLTEQGLLQSSNIPVVTGQSGSNNAPQQQGSNQSTQNDTSFSWVVGIVIIVLIGGGIAAMKYAVKR